MFRKISVTALAFAALTTSASAQDFKLSSTTVSEGQQLSSSLVFNGFGCEGGNRSPQLAWSGVPTGTKSFAITAYDPESPTGSGWWHWNVVNIPVSVLSLDERASGHGAMPQAARELANDYGTKGFGGACPPPGQVHRYVFTVYALATERLDLPENPSNVLTDFRIGASTLAKAHITAVYNR